MSSAPYYGPPLKVGPYWVEDRLGRGGMGEVYRGFDERLERPVALKHVRTDQAAGSTAMQRLRREAKAIARLNHPAIVQVYDWVESDDGWWYVMELVEGQTLKSVIGGEPLPAAQVITVGCAVAEGLAVAHEAGIIHRDLKPDNVMIAESGKVKLLDFGLAKTFYDEAEDLTLTGEKKIVGTVTAMSPEQACGQPVDERTDLFSLGSLLYEAATGKSPFLRQTAMQTLTMICTQTQVPAIEVHAEVPRGLSALIDHLLEKEAGQRPENARAVLDRLHQVGSEDSADSGELAQSVTLAAARPAAVAVKAARSRLTQSSSLGTSERRQVTVLSAGVLSGDGEPLDSEALYEALPRLEGLARDVAERWESHMEEVHGHRLVWSFGYPRSHEGETRRAVRAAVELVEEVTQLGVELGQPLSARAGLQTGLAVAAAQGQEERLVLGRLLDVANGLQDSAEPGTVVLGAATHDLVHRFFDCRRRTPVQIGGKREPEAAHQVIAAREDPAADHDLELVARREELDLMLGRWRLTRAGEGQAVLLTGAAGIGKSRLVRELSAHLTAEGVVLWTFYGSPDASTTPLHPVLQPLRQILALDASTGPEGGLAALEAFVDRLDLDLDDHVPYLATLLALPLGERYRPPDLGPRRQQEKMQEVLLSVMLTTAQERRLALVVEDLQWLDPSTLALVRLLVEDVASVPLLAVLTARPELEAPWRQQAQLTQIALGRLEDADTERLIEKVTGGRELAPEVRALIAEKTDGVPLFVEELTKALLESDDIVDRDGRLELATDLDSPALPATLRDSLSARLDRVGPARWVAQIAAVLGRNFTFEQLQAAAEIEYLELQRLLDDLVHAELLLRRGFGARRRYSFKHALIREAAYDSLLAGERRRLHGVIAGVLEDDRRVTERQPERLARHLTEAGQNEEAIGWWRAAGELAISRSAHREGVDHLERGLALAEKLPAGEERVGLELALLTKLGAAYAVLKGYSAPEVEVHFRRAHELCRDLDDDPQLFWVLWGLWSFHLVRADLEAAAKLGRRMLTIAEAADDADLQLTSLGALGMAHYFHGDLAAARRHLDHAVELDDESRDSPVASVSGQDVGVVALAARALVLWHQGEGAEAVASSDAAVALARRVEHSYSLAFAQAYAARLHQSRRDTAALAEHAGAVVALSQEKGYFWIAQGSFFLGCQAGEAAFAEHGTIGDEALEQARRKMTAGAGGYRDAGARLSETYMLAQQAELYLCAGELDDAARCLDDAAAAIESGSERYWAAEVWRLRGELLVARDLAADAEEPLRDALALAHERGDKAFELRAALSLGRWLEAAGRGGEAAELVDEAVAASADEGSADLEAARAFTSTLAGV